MAPSGRRMVVTWAGHETPRDPCGACGCRGGPALEGHRWAARSSEWRAFMSTDPAPAAASVRDHDLCALDCRDLERQHAVRRGQAVVSYSGCSAVT